MNSVQVTVAEKIANLAPEVADSVTNILVKRELDRRSDSLVKVLDLLEREEKDFKKLGADVKTYDEKGNLTSESFSKDRTEARKKAQERQTKIANAINRALEKADFSDVYNLAKSKGDSEEKSE